MAVEERVTYCRICEPLCGLVATVEDGRLTKLRPDPDHPLSAGFACPKGIAMDEIGSRLKRIRERDGGSAIAWYMGNPGAFSYSHPLWVKGFLDGVGSPH